MRIRPLKWRLRIWLASICLISLILMWLFGRYPDLVERFYVDPVGLRLSRIAASLTGWIPISVGELLLFALLAAFFFSLARSLRLALRGERGWSIFLSRNLADLLLVLLVGTSAFYLFWGLNHSRPALVERQGWQPWEGVEAHQAKTELIESARQLVDAANRAYQTVQSGAAPGGAPFRLEEIDRGVERGFRELSQRMKLPDTWTVERGPAKPLILSTLTSYLGISGLYSPWTGEANFNSMTPFSQLPHTIAHEKAHQRGIASEDEANFFGFLACAASDHPYVRYSGLLFAQGQLLFELSRISPRDALGLRERRLPGVRDDLIASGRFWRSYQGPARKVSRAVNDSYLHAHGVVGGIDAYRLSSRLLLIEFRRQGGRFLPNDQKRPRS